MALTLVLLGAPPARAQSTTAPTALHFTDFFVRPVGARGLEFTEALRRAAGQQVRLVGYIVPQEMPAAGRFLLSPRPVRLSEHADGDADDLPPSTVTVLLDRAHADRIVAAPDHPVSLVGTLAVGRLDDGSGRVSWVRLQLPPEAVAAQPIATSSQQKLTYSPRRSLLQR